MLSILKAFKFAKEQPLGCLMSMILSTILILCVMGALAFVSYSLVAVSAFKSAITDATGFHMSADSIFLNLYTHKCTINNVTFENPSAYDVRNISTRLTFENDFFVIAKKIELELSPSDLIFGGKLKIKSIRMDIAKLSCMRINNSTYNLPEFIDGMKKIVEFPTENGVPYLEEFSLKVDKIGYKDLSNTRDIMHWDVESNIDYTAKNIDNMELLAEEVVKRFNDANAGFISKSILVK